MFEHILLEQEQKDILAALVEATRNVLRSKRKKFDFTMTHAGSWIGHWGLPDKRLDAYSGDIDELERAGLIRVTRGRHGFRSFDVTPLGVKYYEEMKERSGQPVQRVEAMIRSYLSAERFRQKYPKAYQKWAEAETKLWESESGPQLTTIGHLCREAMQEFVTVLVDQYQPGEIDKDKAHTIVRLRSVLELRANQLGKTEEPFLDALLAYWKTLNKLVQRQEHGAQKEGESLVWEDGRRVIFQTCVVMFEIDRALS